MNDGCMWLGIVCTHIHGLTLCIMWLGSSGMPATREALLKMNRNYPIFVKKREEISQKLVIISSQSGGRGGNFHSFYIFLLRGFPKLVSVLGSIQCLITWPCAMTESRLLEQARLRVRGGGGSDQQGAPPGGQLRPDGAPQVSDVINISVWPHCLDSLPLGTTRVTL